MFFLLLGFISMFIFAYMCKKTYLKIGDQSYKYDNLNVELSESEELEHDLPDTDVDDDDNELKEHIENIKNSLKLDEPNNNISYPLEKEMNEENKDKNI